MDEMDRIFTGIDDLLAQPYIQYLANRLRESHGIFAPDQSGLPRVIDHENRKTPIFKPL